MDDFTIVVAEGATIADAVTTLETKIKKDYGHEDAYIGDAVNICPVGVPHKFIPGQIQVVFIATTTVVFCKRKVVLAVNPGGDITGNIIQP